MIFLFKANGNIEIPELINKVLYQTRAKNKK